MTSYRDRLLAGVYDGEPVDEEPEPEPEPEVENGGYVCDECGKSFTSEHGLKIHQGKAHAPADEPDAEAAGYMQ